MEILEDEDEIVKNILDLFSHEAVLGDSKAMRDLSEVIYNIICTIGPGNLDENDLKRKFTQNYKTRFQEYGHFLGGCSLPSLSMTQFVRIIFVFSRGYWKISRKRLFPSDWIIPSRKRLLHFLRQ